MVGVTLLGGASPAAFLRTAWQKRPRLIRQAVPGFRGLVDRRALFSLATRADVTSRLVVDHGPGRARRWERHDGPFGALGARMLPTRGWTLLVHGLEGLVRGGWELLRAFSFVPAARVDDLMVSYAADGGSVGPHDDRYDVFLLQGPGRRRWRLARGGDRALDARASIDVLARFEPEEEHLLEPGDMLYLPPGVAHHGVAEGPCYTYSIGFLAPAEDELVRGFAGWLAGVAGSAEVDADAIYADPGLRPPRDALALPDAMIAYARGAIERHLHGLLREPRLAEDFLGAFLTRPRPRARFVSRRGVSAEALARRLRGRGALRLALPTRALVRGDRVFVNGEAHALPAAARRALDPLLRDRSLRLPWRVPPPLLPLLVAWLAVGWIELDARA